MNLFLDTISPKNTLILFNNQKEILNKYFFDVRLNESTLLIEELDKFLQKNNVKYNDLENLVVVAWPWSFTWVRTTILLINTINFVIKKSITSLTYFDLFQKFPIIKTSSKKDSFIKISENSEIEIIENSLLDEKIKNFDTIYWDIIIENKNIINDVNYEEIIKNIKFQNNKIVTPFYLKKPNIS